MTIKEAYELYSETDNKLKEIKNIMKRITIRYQQARNPWGYYELCTDEMDAISKLLAEYCEIMEERMNEMI